MLQFSSNDTVKWRERFGRKIDGDDTPSGIFSNPNQIFSGVQAALTGIVDINGGFSEGDLVFIHQSRDGGDNVGDHQLNKILSIAGTTFTFKYPLQQNFNTKAQILKIKQNRNIVIDGSLSAPDWDGFKGGIIVLMGDSVSGSGVINLRGKGYRGGLGNNNSNICGDSGEGTAGSSVAKSSSANGNGGSGGNVGPSAPARPAAGGGNATIGGGTNPGAVVGNATLTIAPFGGGGGGYGMDSPVDVDGQDGGGLLVVIAKDIDFSNMSVVDAGGVNGLTNSASGAGGATLLKGQRIKGMEKVSALGGTSSPGGIGSVGRIRAEYSVRIEGVSTPTASVFRDNTFNDLVGAALLMSLR